MAVDEIMFGHFKVDQFSLNNTSIHKTVFNPKMTKVYHNISSKSSHFFPSVPLKESYLLELMRYRRLGTMTFSIKTLSLMTHIIMTLSLMGIFATLGISINEIQHNYTGAIMLSGAIC